MVCSSCSPSQRQHTTEAPGHPPQRKTTIQISTYKKNNILCPHHCQAAHQQPPSPRLPSPRLVCTPPLKHVRLHKFFLIQRGWVSVRAKRGEKMQTSPFLLRLVGMTENNLPACMSPSEPGSLAERRTLSGRLYNRL